MNISRKLLDTLPHDKIVALLTKLATDAGKLTCTYREVVPATIREKLPIFKGYVTGTDVAEAFSVTDRHGRRLLNG